MPKLYEPAGQMLLRGAQVSPNGRRRWRKWLARQRKHRESPDGGGLEPWCWWLSPEGTSRARRHRGSSMVDGQWNADGEKCLGELPDLSSMTLPRPAFAARSLVGMSEKAKRRTMGHELDALPIMERAGNLVRLVTKYGIGERLRPCPGCKNCGYEPTVKLWMLRRGLWCYGSLGVRDISRICHGNGIVPARKARKARG